MEPFRSCLDGNEVAKNERKRYSRDELFKLAKLMSADTTILENLSRYESSEFAQHHMNGVCPSSDDSEYQRRLIGSTMGLGNQTSEFGSNYTSLIEYSGRANSGRDRCRASLSRMTSSPIIKYNQKDRLRVSLKSNLNDENQTEMAESGQTKSQLGARQQKQALSGTMSHNTWFHKYQPQSVNRPTTLFGPLRREVSHQSSTQASEEPLSLPYVTNYSQLAGYMPSSASSVIKSLNSTDRAQYCASNEMNDEDEFDISNLLSITVLSDIKTMKQDASSGERRKPTQARYLARGRSQNFHVKPLTRAKTTAEFTTRGRSKHDIESIYPSNDHYMRTQFYEAPLPSKFNLSQYNSNDLRKVAPIVSQVTKRGINEPMDESTAQIIESFKSQVRARAKELGPGVAKDGSNVKPHESSHCSVISANRKEENGSNDPSTNGDSLTNTRGSSADRSLPQKVPEITGDYESSELGISGPSGSEKLVTKRVSNIPRLIALHKKSVRIEERDKDDFILTTAGSNPSKTNIAGKIISQYRQLRGKSLDEEIREAS